MHALQGRAHHAFDPQAVFAVGLLEPDPAAGFADHGGAKLPLGAPTAFDQTTGPKRFMGHNEYIVYEASRHKIKYVLQCRAG